MKKNGLIAGRISIILFRKLPTNYVNVPIHAFCKLASW